MIYFRCWVRWTRVDLKGWFFNVSFLQQMKLIATNFCVVFVIMVCFYAGPPPALGKQ